MSSSASHIDWAPSNIAVIAWTHCVYHGHLCELRLRVPFQAMHPIKTDKQLHIRQTNEMKWLRCTSRQVHQISKKKIYTNTRHAHEPSAPNFIDSIDHQPNKQIEKQISSRAIPPVASHPHHCFYCFCFESISTCDASTSNTNLRLPVEHSLPARAFSARTCNCDRKYQTKPKQKKQSEAIRHSQTWLKIDFKPLAWN